VAIDLTIIACHMLGEYVTQTDWMAARKLLDWRPRLIHVATYTAGMVFVPLQAHMSLARAVAFLLAIGIPHFIVDCRRWASGEVWVAKPIMVDQAIHLVCVAITATAFGI
jgi:hypothetical protein